MDLGGKVENEGGNLRAPETNSSVYQQDTYIVDMRASVLSTSPTVIPHTQQRSVRVWT